MRASKRIINFLFIGLVLGLVLGLVFGLVLGLVLELLLVFGILPPRVAQTGQVHPLAIEGGEHSRPLRQNAPEQLGIFMVDVLLLPPPGRLIEAVYVIGVLAHIEVGLLVRDAQELRNYFAVPASELLLRLAHHEAAGLLFSGVVQVDDARVALLLFVRGQHIPASDPLNRTKVPDVEIAHVSLLYEVPALQRHIVAIVIFCGTINSTKLFKV